jgi:hypothetical protein
MNGGVMFVYLRELRFWTPFTIETRLAAVDKKWVFLEQRFLVDGKVHAVGVSKIVRAHDIGDSVQLTECAPDQVFKEPSGKTADPLHVLQTLGGLEVPEKLCDASLAGAVLAAHDALQRASES